MKIHFIGIGGIGMSALAGISLKNGHLVSGSDKERSKNTDALKKIGAKIYIGHDKNNLAPDTDLLVISQAIIRDNPELLKAKGLGIPIKERSEYLGDLMENKKSIAVAGTHGKTTISSMISVILEKAREHPTIAVGGLISEIGNSNWKCGKSDTMVVEACEYRSAFLKLKPFIEIISNIELEHLDCFKDLNEIINIFTRFLKILPKDGFAVVNGDDINIQKILDHESLDNNIITYGTEEGGALWKIAHVIEENGQVSFDVFKNRQKIDNFIIKIPGKHNALNSLAAIIVTSKLGVNLKTIKEALKNFKGTKRRMEIKGEKGGILVIDDYGHHPTEIKATLEAIKNFYKDRNKIWCVFQPHQYSRTRLLFSEFINSFKDADELIINDIYEVRDSKKDVKSVSAKKLAEAIQEENITKTSYIGAFKDTAKYLKMNTKAGDLILTIGAGPVYKVGELFLK